MSVGIYLHIPFCRGEKCPYCDFYSLPFSQSLADDYTAALCRAMEAQPFSLPPADTLYLGGGTPALLGERRLAELLDQAARCFSLGQHSEITLEANPESVTPRLLQALRQAGFNRISFGVQSGVEAELAALGRPHTAAQAQRALLAAYDAGFSRISADLMLAVPGQTPDSLAQSVAFLQGLPVEHLSAYLLKIEEGTAFARQGAALELPEEDAAADLYLLCNTLLEQAGFPRYEISNFARPGGESRHNLNYWRCGQYLGLGPAAHSFVAGRRVAFPRDLQAFLKAENPFALLADEGPGGGVEEELLLRLRLTEGFDTGLLAGFSLDPAPLLEEARRLAAHGLCRVAGGRISLTARGCLLSNSVIAALLAALD